MKRILFVDDEMRVLQGLQRQLRGLRTEWEMHFLDCGPKALDFLGATSVDVIVSDMMMPGMDGAQLLTEVMKRHPNTIRLVLSGHADREAVLRLVGPAHQYLSKPCEPEELRSAIAGALAMRELLTSPRLMELASRIRCLPSLPALHGQVAAELRKEEPSMERIAQLISRDVGMATKILQLVNSAFFGLPQRVTNVMDAVTYLGLATIRTLVLSVQVFSLFDQRTIKEFSIDELARHCWVTSVFARRIAEAENGEPKLVDQCFLAGLLHDVGYLILAAGLGEQYAEVLGRARASAQPVWEVELAALGATHAEVGAYLLGLWGLPTPIVEAVALHHRPARGCSAGFSPVIAVHVANAITHDLLPSHAGQPSNRVDVSHLEKLGLAAKLDAWKARCLESSCCATAAGITL